MSAPGRIVIDADNAAKLFHLLRQLPRLATATAGDAIPGAQAAHENVVAAVEVILRMGEEGISNDERRVRSLRFEAVFDQLAGFVDGIEDLR